MVIAFAVTLFDLWNPLLVMTCCNLPAQDLKISNLQVLCAVFVAIDGFHESSIDLFLPLFGHCLLVQYE